MSQAAQHEILIADDDASIREMLTRAFANDFRVHAARDGAEALRILDRTVPAAVIVDEMMPGATGTEVLERAKVMYPTAPRVLMTASNDPERAVKAVNHGEIHRFYTKPIRVVEVRRAVLDLVERARGAEALRVELATLRELRNENTQVRAAGTRTVIISGSATGDLVEEACKLRNYSVTRAKPDQAVDAIMRGQADLLVLVPEPGVDVRSLARLAHTLDEVTAVVLVDDVARLETAIEALETGAVDYVAPLIDAVSLAQRLERAASRPRAQRDMRRLTFDLIVANRELALARRRVEDDQVKILQAMIRALEARDSYTAGHTDRVAAISVRVGETLGMVRERLDVVRIGALLHDIGKIGIRDEVLLKPGRLSPEEFEVIKTHTVIGASLLEGIQQFECILPIVRGHHERLDGSGYPDQKKGDAIPLEVRCVSASDVLDAVTSTRPYRRGSGVEDAFEILRGMTGAHLDPVVVGALHQMHKENRLLELLQQGGDHSTGPGPYGGSAA